MTRATRETPVPAPDEPVDARAALGQARDLAHLYGQAVHVLRAYVEAEAVLKAAETRHAALEQRSAEIERELPALEQRLKTAHQMAAQAEQLGRDAYAQAAATVQAEIAEAQQALVRVKADGGARALELEATYRARLAALAHQTEEAEARLARVEEELAAVVARHAR